MKSILTSLFTIITFLAFGQFDYGCDNSRYINSIGKTIKSETVQFGKNILPSGDSMTLLMDFYYPENDQVDARPLIVLAHSGSFIGGDRAEMKDYCIRFAERGYVAATIDYRILGIAGGVPDSLKAMDIAIKASHDLKGAVRWFKGSAILDGNPYNIDPEMIFIGGYSAGAVTALIAGLIDENEITNPFINSLIAANGGLNGNTGNPDYFGYDTEFKGIISLSGAVYDTSWIDVNDPVIYSIHGDKDDILDYEYGFATVFGIQIIPLHGSANITKRTNNLGKEGFLYTVIDGGHTDIYFFPQFEQIRNEFLGISELAFATIICGTIIANEEIEFAKLQVFPNPVQNELFINGLMENTKIRLLGMNGNVVLEGQLESGKINIESLPTGLYIYQVKLGEKIYVGKVIKQ